MIARPALYVLAGVNGAGKSTIGGYLLKRAGLAWFNPDAFARALVDFHAMDQTTANAAAWHEGVRRLDLALAHGESYAFETTLGGNTITAKIKSAAQTHDVLLWFCGLTTPELHLARVQARVAAGGHDIPEAMIRSRCVSALQNLIALMPVLKHLKIYDNSAQAEQGRAIADPVLLAQMHDGQLIWPNALDVAQLQATPDWAKPLLEAALRRMSL